MNLGSAILEKFYVRGTYYVIPKFLGTSNDDGRFASPEDIISLAQSGHEIGNHTYNHDREFCNWSRHQQTEDLAQADSFFDDLNIHTATFAYPFGLHNTNTVRTITDSQFAVGRTIDFGINTSQTDPLLLKSFMIEDKHTLSDVKQVLEDTIDTRGWLILTFHHIDDKTFISTPPELFESMISSIIATGIEFVTVKEGARRLFDRFS